MLLHTAFIRSALWQQQKQHKLTLRLTSISWLPVLLAMGTCAATPRLTHSWMWCLNLACADPLQETLPP